MGREQDREGQKNKVMWMPYEPDPTGHPLRDGGSRPTAGRGAGRLSKALILHWFLTPRPPWGG